MRKPLIGILVALVVLGLLAAGGWFAYRYLYERFTPEVCSVDLPGAEPTTLSPEQARNASIIVAASVERGLPEQAAVVAIATAYQESALRNLDYGDRDSLGLFQQRPSYGWGTEEEIMDPWYSSNRFYEELVKFDNWETTDVNDMAQKVQRSGHPEAYRKHEEKARAVAGALRGSRPASLSCLSFESSPAPEASAFERVLQAYGDALTVTVEPTTVRIVATDEAGMWAAAHQVVANSYSAGATSVVVGGQEWRHDRKGWGDADESGPELTVVVTLGGK